MRRRYFAAAAVLFVAATVVVGRQQPRPFQFHYDHVMGTSMDLTVMARSERGANAAATAVLGQIDRDAKILSGYDTQSEFSRWFATRGRAIRVSHELYEVLDLFDQWRDRSGGALDASAETVSRVWKQAASLKRLPSDEEIAAAVDLVRQPHWRLDASAQTATHLDAAPLVLNSFTKSYIIDRAATAALESGASAVVVNAGGDIVTRGRWTETLG